MGGGGQNLARHVNINRHYSQIIQEAKTTRNVLELFVPKPDQPDPANPAQTMSMDTLSEIIYTHLGIRHEDLLTYNYDSSPYGIKELAFKPNVDLSGYCFENKTVHVQGKDFSICTRIQGDKFSKMYFKGTPLYVPNEELLNFAKHYGKVEDDVVYYERPRGRDESGCLDRLIDGSTRYVLIKPGDKPIPNYVWMEGPLLADRPARVLVTLPGNPKQCYNCLEFPEDCPGCGIGKACKELEPSKGAHKKSAPIYMKQLWSRDKYMTLKTRYKVGDPNFPPLHGNHQSQVELVVDQAEEEDGDREYQKEEMEGWIKELGGEISGLEKKRDEIEENVQKLGGEVNELEVKKARTIREISELRKKARLPETQDQQIREDDLWVGLEYSHDMASNALIEEVIAGTQTLTRQ